MFEMVGADENHFNLGMVQKLPDHVLSLKSDALAHVLKQNGALNSKPGVWLLRYCQYGPDIILAGAKNYAGHEQWGKAIFNTADEMMTDAVFKMAFNVAFEKGLSFLGKNIAHAGLTRLFTTLGAAAAGATAAPLAAVLLVNLGTSIATELLVNTKLFNGKSILDLKEEFTGKLMEKLTSTILEDSKKISANMLLPLPYTQEKKLSLPQQMSPANSFQSVSRENKKEKAEKRVLSFDATTGSSKKLAGDLSEPSHFFSAKKNKQPVKSPGLSTRKNPQTLLSQQTSIGVPRLICPPAVGQRKPAQEKTPILYNKSRVLQFDRKTGSNGVKIKK